MIESGKLAIGSYAKIEVCGVQTISKIVSKDEITSEARKKYLTNRIWTTFYKVMEGPSEGMYHACSSSYKVEPIDVEFLTIPECFV